MFDTPIEIFKQPLTEIPDFIMSKTERVHVKTKWWPRLIGKQHGLSIRAREYDILAFRGDMTGEYLAWAEEEIKAHYKSADGYLWFFVSGFGFRCPTGMPITYSDFYPAFDAGYTATQNPY
jgi:hypothetical protein